MSARLFDVAGRVVIVTGGGRRAPKPLPVQESADLLEALFDVQERPEFVYEHRWRVGDLVLWENRCTRARDFDANERRWLRRVTIKGEKPA